MQKVLLIEDSKIVKILHERALTRAGYEVVHAADGEVALRMAAAVAPDIVLLDMLLPKISGPEVLHALKENPATAHIPVIVLTALSRRNEEKLLRDGADAFLEKGDLLQSTEPLIALVKRVLQESPANRSVTRTEAGIAWVLNGTESGTAART